MQSWISTCRQFLRIDYKPKLTWSHLIQAPIFVSLIEEIAEVHMLLLRDNNVAKWYSFLWYEYYLKIIHWSIAIQSKCWHCLYFFFWISINVSPISSLRETKIGKMWTVFGHIWLALRIGQSEFIELWLWPLWALFYNKWWQAKNSFESCIFWKSWIR